MADNKKSFVAYCDWKNTFQMLTDEESGKLIKHLFSYVNDENPELDDRLLKLAFEPIKMQLKRDLKKYEDVRHKRSEAGKLGGRPKAKKANGFNKKQIEANKAVNDNDTVNVDDNVNVIENTPKPPKGDSSETSKPKKQKIDWQLLLQKFNEITGKEAITVPDKAKRQIRARLKEGYSRQQILIAIKNCTKDPYHIENPKYLTLEFISRSDKFEKYVQAINSNSSNQPQKEGIYKNIKSV